MSAVKKPDYPEALTVKYWNKKKGVLARISKVKTGITEQLEKAHDLFEDVPWEKLDLHAYLPGRYDRDQLDAALQRLKEETSDKVNKAYKGMRSLENFLHDKAEDLEKNEKTKKFAEDVEEMSKAAKKFSFTLAVGTLSEPITAAYNQAVIGLNTRAQVMGKTNETFKKYVRTALDATEEGLEKGMSAQFYTTEHWPQNLRGIGTFAGKVAENHPELKEPMQRAAQYWVQSALPKNDQAVPAQLEKDRDVLQDYWKVAKDLA
jgi:hypothetical protein